MVQYSPLRITGMQTGLVQQREEFILPDDAYPTLENAYIWRERILRKKCFEKLARLERVLTAQALGNTVGAQTTYTFANLLTTIGITGQPNASIDPGTLVITIAAPDAATFTDNGLGGFVVTGAGVSLGSSVNYSTGAVTIVLSASAGGAAITAALGYYPSLPVMGLRLRQLNSISNEDTIAFDTVYAYKFNFLTRKWNEWIPGTTWTGTNYDFFWTTNYWQINNNKLFWVTNFSGISGDPIRYTDGATWTNFAPTINAAGDVLAQCLCIVPFRGRLLAFNTLEGPSLAASTPYYQRIRWSAIGNPIPDLGAIPPYEPWIDDVRGRGGFLDIPTSENIVSVGFVRDNLVIYCESSTWQLRYTGATIQPFNIEKVNSELGAESTFSAVQFDTSLVGVGDKGVVECDSYKSQRIDIKIPDLVYTFNNLFNGINRVYGIRDFQNRLAYWTYPNKEVQPDDDEDNFPNRRLVYNYENDSWAIFTDSLTCLGQFQDQVSRTWANSVIPWQQAKFPWLDRPALFPSIIGGNQQGFTVYLDELTTNDPSIYIKNITGRQATSQATRIESPSHNLEDGQVIKITNILAGTPFATSLNNQIFSVNVINVDNFDLYVYNPINDSFDLPQYDTSAVYVGGGLISVRDNFSIKSKKFNFLDEGQNIQLGFLDILMEVTSIGAITMKIYENYNDSTASNVYPNNFNNTTGSADAFFNSVIPTTLAGSSTKLWQRVFCAVRAAFLTIEYTLSNSQMIGNEQASAVQIDAQILWIRKAGKQLPFGF